MLAPERFFAPFDVKGWGRHLRQCSCMMVVLLLRPQLAVPSHVAAGPAAKDKEKEKEKDRERAAALAAKAQLAAHGQIRCSMTLVHDNVLH
jgi:hypothetical protein